jgi:hypothetical protein
MHATLRPCPTTEADLKALEESLVDRILRVRRQHYRETGRRLSYADAFDEVARRADLGLPVDGDAGFTRDELSPVACHLAGLDYSQQAIDGALADVGRCGTAGGSLHIDAEDRDAVEELIPARACV